MKEITKEQAFELYSECQKDLAKNYFPKFKDGFWFQGSPGECSFPEITKEEFDFWFSIPNRWVWGIDWNDTPEFYFFRYKELKFGVEFRRYEDGTYPYIGVDYTLDTLRFDKKKCDIKSIEREADCQELKGFYCMELGRFYSFISRLDLDDGQENDAKVLADFATPKLPKERIVTCLPLKVGENVHHVHSYLNSICKEFMN